MDVCRAREGGQKMKMEMKNGNAGTEGILCRFVGGMGVRRHASYSEVILVIVKPFNLDKV